MQSTKRIARQTRIQTKMFVHAKAKQMQRMMEEKMLDPLL